MFTTFVLFSVLLWRWYVTSMVLLLPWLHGFISIIYPWFYLFLVTRLYLYDECAKFRASRVFVLHVATCLASLCAICAHVITCLCAFASYVPFLFYVPYIPSLFYVPYVPSNFTCLTCPYFFTCLHALCALSTAAWYFYFCQYIVYEIVGLDVVTDKIIFSFLFRIKNSLLQLLWNILQIHSKTILMESFILSGALLKIGSYHWCFPAPTQLAFICSNQTMKTSEQCIKSDQS